MSSAAKIALTPWLDALTAAIPRVREEGDPEAVHALRVALARIRVWLMFTGSRRLRRKLRELRNKAAALRDVDVQLAQRPPRAVARMLERRRRAARQVLLDALARPALAALLRSLEALPAVKRPHARKRLKRMAREALRRARAARRHPSDMKRLHDWRRAVRRVRFALEWLGDDAEALVAQQQALGEALDRAHMLATLRGIDATDAALRGYRRRLKRELREAEHAARDRWRAARRRLNDLA